MQQWQHWMRCISQSSQLGKTETLELAPSPWCCIFFNLSASKLALISIDVPSTSAVVTVVSLPLEVRICCMCFFCRLGKKTLDSTTGSLWENFIMWVTPVWCECLRISLQGHTDQRCIQAYYNDTVYSFWLSIRIPFLRSQWFQTFDYNRAWHPEN